MVDEEREDMFAVFVRTEAPVPVGESLLNRYEGALKLAPTEVEIGIPDLLTVLFMRDTQ